MTTAAATIFHHGKRRRNLPQVPPTTSTLYQGSLTCGSDVHSNNINNNNCSENISSNTKNFSQDGAQFQKKDEHENGIINANLMEKGKLFCKSSQLKRENSLDTNVGYVSYNRDINKRNSSEACAKTKDYHFYKRISSEKTREQKNHSYERMTNEMCDSFRDNLLNNNTAMTSNSEVNSLNFNSGIKRNCGRILPIPSSSIRPLSLKIPLLARKLNENRNNCSVREKSLSQSQARPLSIVFPTPRCNINHSLQTNLPMGESAHSSITIPSPKYRPSTNQYQRLKYSPNKNSYHTRNHTDLLNNNSNLTSVTNSSYISTTVPSPSSPSYDFDHENNNVHRDRISFLNEFKSTPLPLLENSVQKNSGFNSSNLIGVQNQQSYPSSVLCIDKSSKQNNLHYPNCTKSKKTNHNISTTMPSTYSPTATTPSSSSSVVNSLPDQPSVLLVVYPVPFVHETDEMITDQHKFNAGTNEDRDCIPYQHPIKESSRCGIQ